MAYAKVCRSEMPFFVQVRADGGESRDGSAHGPCIVPQLVAAGGGCTLEGGIKDARRHNQQCAQIEGNQSYISLDKRLCRLDANKPEEHCTGHAGAVTNSKPDSVVF